MVAYRKEVARYIVCNVCRWVELEISTETGTTAKGSGPVLFSSQKHKVCSLSSTHPCRPCCSCSTCSPSQRLVRLSCPCKVPCSDIRYGSMAEVIALQNSGDQALELCTVSGLRVLLTVDIGGIADHGRRENLDFASKLVELGIVDQDKGDLGDVALLECSCTNVHLVLCDLAPTIHKLSGWKKRWRRIQGQS